MKYQTKQSSTQKFNPNHNNEQKMKQKKDREKRNRHLGFLRNHLDIKSLTLGEHCMIATGASTVVLESRREQHHRNWKVL